MQGSNPFDDPQGQFYILRNAQLQYSLWPQQCDLPAGWQVMLEPRPLEQCNAWLSGQVTTLTPAHYATAGSAA
ncbi:MbtH family NRPS accessory protein [Yokenella regensburgei]|jgi:enterochelin esterase family protein|uniref:MbtH family protein n=1 Tax=Yokenella regensburgei TaxID=158877 RepID=UPI0027D9356E|nr:MbtH family NRPS accessory protein [Yokenella regensburgei]MDQ4431306.1 MbtH family NRPS accessory protein [Yokenella regensburgei]